MRKLYPVSVDAMDFSSAPRPFQSKLAEKIKSGVLKTARTLAELENYDQESGFVDFSAAVQLGIIGTDVALKVGHRIYIHEFSQFHDYDEQDEVVRVGVGVRFIFVVDLFNFDLELTSLAPLAAAAELNYAKVNTRFSVIGIHGRAITDALPKTVDALSIEGYSRIVESMDCIRGKMHETEGVIISPTVLSVGRADQRELCPTLSPEMVARVAALQCISNGLSQRKAQSELIDRRKLKQDLQVVIEHAYMELLGAANQDVRPSQDAIEKAKKQLFGWTG
jgi:hypothetical protein